MDTGLYALLSRLESNPSDELAWLQVKRELKRNPESVCCDLLFGYLASSPDTSPLQSILVEHGLEILPEVLLFYNAFLDRTEAFGDIWGGGREFWYTVQFFEILHSNLYEKLPGNKAKTLNQTLERLRRVTAQHAIATESNELKLPFLPQEVAWNLSLYSEPAIILADYPEFRHMYFLPSELLPLTFDLENYKLTPQGERYLQTLLHETRIEAFKANLLHFAQTFPLVLQAKWAYAVYISLGQVRGHKHPFVRRLLANSYWEARANGQLTP